VTLGQTRHRSLPPAGCRGEGQVLSSSLAKQFDGKAPRVNADRLVARLVIPRSRPLPTRLGVVPRAPFGEAFASRKEVASLGRRLL
jgi:hypothetical protein